MKIILLELQNNYTLKRWRCCFKKF